MQWVGYVAALMTTLVFLPQAIHTIRTRETQGLSLGMYAVFTLGTGFWMVYGWFIGSWPVMVSNAVTCVLASIILVLKLRHG